MDSKSAGLTFYYTKINQAKEPQLYFSLLNFIKFHTWKNIFMLSRQEDLCYGVSKLGNKITKGQKVTWFLGKTTQMKPKCCCVKSTVTCLWMFWKEFVGRKEEKLNGHSATYLTTEIQHFLQIFVCRLPRDRSFICFEDGGLLLALRRSHEMLLC